MDNIFRCSNATCRKPTARRGYCKPCCSEYEKNKRLGLPQTVKNNKPNDGVATPQTKEKLKRFLVEFTRVPIY